MSALAKSNGLPLALTRAWAQPERNDMTVWLLGNNHMLNAFIFSLCWVAVGDFNSVACIRGNLASFGVDKHSHCVMLKDNRGINGGCSTKRQGKTNRTVPLEGTFCCIHYACKVSGILYNVKCNDLKFEDKIAIFSSRGNMFLQDM